MRSISAEAKRHEEEAHDIREHPATSQPSPSAVYRAAVREFLAIQPTR